MTIPASNPQTFGWIKTALIQSMDAAIDAVSDVQSSDDLSDLGLVSKNLHQIQGSLQMVELDAASVLAEDLETLTAHFGQINPVSEKAVDVLTTGLAHLKLYLQAIDDQNPQSPLILVDDINAIREITGKSKISQHVLFDPPLEFGSAVSDIPVLSFSPEKRQNILYHLRKRFRQALLAWLKNRNRGNALDVMKDLMVHLHRIGGPEVLQQLWWVAAGFVETIKNSNQEPDPEIKAQFAALDIELHRMREDMLSDIASFPPDELIRNMLFHIGRSAISTEMVLNGERVSEIRHLMGLDQWFSYDSDSVFSNELTELVNAVTALASDISQEDMTHLENKIDRYFLGEFDAEQKTAFFDDLDTLRSSVNEAHFGPIKDFILAFCDATQNSNLDTKYLLKTGADIKIASALLMFDSLLKEPEAIDNLLLESVSQKTEELRRLIDNDSSNTDIEAGSKQQALAEFSSARLVVVKEINRYLGQVEQLLSDTSGGSSGSDVLPSVMSHLSEISGLFGFLDEDQAKGLTRESLSLIQRVVDNNIDFDTYVKEKFAFVIASIGVCTDMMSKQSDQYQEIIVRAQGVLDAIEGSDSEGVDEHVDKSEDDNQSERIDEYESVDIEVSADVPESIDVDEEENDEISVVPLELEQPQVDETAVSDDVPSDDITPDIVENKPLLTEELIEDLESVIEDIGGNQSNSIKPILEKIHDARKSINFSDPDHGGLLHLLLLFNSIEDNSANLKNPDTGELVAIGSELITKVIYEDISFTAEIEDYIGRLCHQIDQLELKDEKQTDIDLESWKSKLISLGTVFPGEVETHSENIEEVEEGDSLEDIDVIEESEELEQIESIEALADLAYPEDKELQDKEISDKEILDEELNSVFVTELRSHSLDLDTASKELLSFVDLDEGVDGRNNDLTDQCIAVQHTIHTLTGNFNNVGVLSVGRSLESATPYLLDYISDAVVAQQYGSVLGELSVGLLCAADEIEAQGTITELTDVLIDDCVSSLEQLSHSIINEESSVREEIVSDDVDLSPEPEGVRQDENERISDEAFDQELRQIFQEESESLLGRINGLLSQWRATGFDLEILAGLRREFHTLKGSAAATGYENISRLSHGLESILEQDDETLSDNNDSLLNLMEEMHDGLASELGFIPGGGESHMSSLISMVEVLLGGEETDVEESETGESKVTPHYPDQEAETKDELSDEEAIVIEKAALSGDSIGDENTETNDGVLEEVSLEKSEEVSISEVEDIDIVHLLSEQYSASMEGSLGTDDNPDEEDDQSGDSGNDKEVVLEDSRHEGEDNRAVVAESDASQEVSTHQGENITQRESENMVSDSQASFMRIENAKLNNLLNYSGELGLTRTQLNTTLDLTHTELERLRESMKKIRDGLRDLEFEADAQMKAMPESQSSEIDEEDFDPLQMDRYSRLQARAREVNQQLDDLARIERQLSERTSELGGTLVQQYHLGEQLQDGLINARMVSVNEYFPRFRQLVREISRRVGKQVSFSAEGGEINLDRQVMDAMVAPFEHMIRNAIMHGIEDSNIREERNKPATGRIHMKITQQGAELLVEFSDDGRGLDKPKLATRAVELGLVSDIDKVSDDLFLQIIAEPGFSTAEKVSMESGRGVGMDVVLEAVRSLGGSIGVTSALEQGTTFQFRLPVTMTISQALLVRIGAHKFAILTRSIDRVMRVRNEEVSLIDNQEYVSVNDQTLPIVGLAEKLGEDSLSTAETYRSLLLIRLADRTAVFEVDQFEETVEIVIKNTG